ncbi:xylulokinase [Marivita sp. S0852]|uniref:xylulokinase n=1 Tax=Marivita sp. S0852 TaxID=3373893 RepID=UPI0039829303
MSYLGIDLGTSGLRALLVSETGAVLGSVERSYRSEHKHSGWSEQDPAHWIAALDEAIEELRHSSTAFGDLRAISVAGHMHGATLIDGTGAVIRPCILWNDTRAHAEARDLDATEQVREISGNIVFPGFTAPKLAWVAKHEPAHFARIHKVLLPAGYLNYHLTGAFVADMSDSAGTSWLNVAERTWSETLLEAGQMRLDQMPRLVEGCQPAGTLRPELARRWGVGDRVIIAGGAGDNAAAACGIGALNEGDGFLSLGTSGVLLAARDGYHPNPASALHTFCHAVPDRWYQMGVMLSATDSLNWLGQITGTSPSDLTADLGETLCAPGRVQFMPYLSGERTPHNDANIRGSFTALGKDTTRSDLTRAVLEGVAFGLRDSHEVLVETGARIDRLLAIGGGTRSRYWVKLISTVLNVPLELPKDGELGAALGAARLAIIAETGEEPDRVLTPPDVAERILPDAKLKDAFDAAYDRFKAGYPTLRTVSSLT